MKKKTDKYVIYDQFHWLDPDHLVRYVEGKREDVLAQYCFYKDAFPGIVLGLCTEAEFKMKLNSIKSEKCNICNN